MWQVVLIRVYLKVNLTQSNRGNTEITRHVETKRIRFRKDREFT